MMEGAGGTEEGAMRAKIKDEGETSKVKIHFSKSSKNFCRTTTMNVT